VESVISVRVEEREKREERREREGRERELANVEK
jgi:hypothetical protein